MINSLAGDDVVEASGLNAVLLLPANGGDGERRAVRRPRIDTFNGDAGDDVLLGNGGIDVLERREATTSSSSDPAAVDSRREACYG